jgi:hypothetical protein
MSAPSELAPESGVPPHAVDIEEDGWTTAYETGCFNERRTNWILAVMEATCVCPECIFGKGCGK